MLPFLDQGDEVFVVPQKVPRRGEYIVFRHPYRTDVVLIKYVAFINEEGDIYVLGTNLEESTDSRCFGWIPSHLIYGRIHSRFRQ